MSSVGAAALDHSAVLHRGPDDLARTMAAPLRAAIERGESVLVSLSPESWAALGEALGPAADAVRWLDASARGATPAGAMVRLHRFASGALDAGAPAVWSLGALPLDGSGADDPWLRYEHAVDHVLADLPLHAVCAYDLDTTPDSALAHVLATHRHVDGVADGIAASDAPVPARPEPRSLDHPFVSQVVESAAVARHLVGALGTDLPDSLRDDVCIVVSELVANAIRHGRPPVRLTVGHGTDSVLVRVQDTGPGIDDPWAELRPPRLAGGRGLNIVAQLSRLHHTHDDGCTTVTAELDLP